MPAMGTQGEARSSPIGRDFSVESSTDFFRWTVVPDFCLSRLSKWRIGDLNP